MFTGLIDHCGIITQIISMPSSLRLWIKHSFPERLALGESIAVDGICLTVAEISNDYFCCDISSETLKLTNAKIFTVEHEVNLERALQPSSRIGGHFVMGHIDQTLFVQMICQIDNFTEITFTGLNHETMKYLLKKGSISVNGVSLTINEVNKDTFKVMLIPHTLARTNLKNCQINDLVNIEFDMLTRIVAKQIENLMP